jgi:hypothetical protein
VLAMNVLGFRELVTPDQRPFNNLGLAFPFIP